VEDDLRALRAITISGSLLVAASSTHAQRSPVDTSTDYLVRITQRWGAASPIDALPTRAMGADDVELRVWGGYGLGGPFGVILRRTDRRWHAWRARVVTCVINASAFSQDVNSPPTDSMLLAEARRGCPRSVAGGGTYYSKDTLALEVADARNAGTVWEQAFRAGVFELPPRVPHERLMVDGFAIVIEVRRGDSYRASKFQAVRPPEVAADSVARQVYRTVMTEFGRLRAGP
jgi:hypothetical protein